MLARIVEIKDRQEKEKFIEECNDAFTISVTGRLYYPELLEKIDKKAVMLGIYEDNGETIGYSAFYANNQETKRAFITLFCIKKSMQRKYFGSHLMAASLDEAKMRGMESVALEVLKQDTGAIEFYQKMGFTEDGPDNGAFIRMNRKL